MGEDEVAEAREEFESIDKNGDGFLERDEIMAMEEVPEAEEITEFFETYDLDKDDKVTFEEILKADEALRKEEEASELEGQAEELEGDEDILNEDVSDHADA